jgi:hypothetical protein
VIAPPLHSRRHFLHSTFLLGWLAGGPWALAAAAARQPPVTFTKAVRDATRKLRITPDRWTWIVAHHSAIKFGNAKIYDRNHKERGMENGLAYHFVIGNGIDSRDGEIEIGARWLRQLDGGHVRREDVNAAGIGICLVGNFQETRPTSRQMLAFRELVDYLRADVTGRKVRFAVHREVDRGRTVCPGRNFPTAEMHKLYG